MQKLGYVLAATISALILAACAGAPTTLYVATTGNDSNDCRSAAQACRTVTAALDKARFGSTIIIGAGTFNESFGIAKFVTIRGAGPTRTTISRAAGGPVIAITHAVTVTLSDLSIVGGYYSLQMGNAFDPSVRNAYLMGNNLSISHGQFGVGIDSGRMQLTNSTITSTLIGIENKGVFTGDHLTIQSITLYGIENHGAMDLSHTTVQQVFGGVGVSNGSEGDAGTARLSFTDGLITNNSGTGLINRSGTTTITSSTISNNHQEGVTNEATMILDHVEVEANTYDGVLSQGDSGTTLQVFRSAFVNNTTGIDLHNTNATIENSTFSGNRGDGINVTNTRLDLSFVTVAFNSRGLVAGSSIVSIHNTIVELNSAINCLGFAPAVLSDAPLACNDSLTNATLHLGTLTLTTGTKVIPLLAGSPAIDAAPRACTPVDQRGYARPYGAACDIGAYETGAAAHLEAATPGTETLPVLEIIADTPTPQLTLKLKEDYPCYSGPGPKYDTLSILKAGTELQVVGYGFGGGWLVAQHPTLQGQHCWIDENFVIVSVPLDTLRLISIPPTPTFTPEPTKEERTPTACPTNPKTGKCE